jgi:P27 family predicted phage terminase small subunit
MGANRQLRASDLVLLRAYVEAVFVHAEASAKVHEFGVLVASPRGPVPNPMIRVQDNAARTIRLLSENLGLNPMARIRAGIMEIAGASMVLELRQNLVRELSR